MTAPVKLNYKIYQGSTFSLALRWESATKAYIPISNITKAAPMVVTASTHGVVQDWRVKITGATGMKEVNTGEYIYPSAVTTDSLTFNSVNSLAYTSYISGAVLEYNVPVELIGYTARMQIREKLTSTSIIDELTTENGLIVLNNGNKTINLNLPASTTAAYTFKTAVYSLELVKDSVVTPLVNGVITLELEVTR